MMIERYCIGALISSSGPMAGSRAEEQCVAGFEHIGAVGVAVTHLAGEHVDELDPVI
jgi:hypothetical protein